MSMDVQSFKDALAHWTSGVTVVTTQMDGRPVGITASSLTSVSLAPPQILICVARKLYTHQVIEQSGVFAVNILGTDHLEWGMRFAGMTPELARRHAFDAEKAAVEVGNVVKAYLKPNVGNAQVRFHKQLAGPVDSDLVDKVRECVARGTAKETRKPALAHAQLAGDVGRTLGFV